MFNRCVDSTARAMMLHHAVWIASVETDCCGVTMWSHFPLHSSTD